MFLAFWNKVQLPLTSTFSMKAEVPKNEGWDLNPTYLLCELCVSTLVRGHWANLSTPSLLSLQSDLLLGILDILDPELFLRSCEQELQEQQQQEQQPLPVPPTSLAALGAPSVKLEALNELIHFDHIYTKPVEEEEVVSSSSSSSDSESDDKMDEVVVVVEQQQEEVEVETVVCIKDEPEEVEVITGHQADFTSSSSPPSSLSGLDQDASLADTYSDSGYERSPSPFSQLPSPLDTETSWDSFASELFPQLITV